MTAAEERELRKSIERLARAVEELERRIAAHVPPAVADTEGEDR